MPDNRGSILIVIVETDFTSPVHLIASRKVMFMRSSSLYIVQQKYYDQHACMQFLFRNVTVQYTVYFGQNIRCLAIISQFVGLIP